MPNLQIQQKYYYERCGGRFCTKLCFPFIKTVAISVRFACCDVFIDHGDFGEYDPMILAQKCKCCCCLFCCTRCFMMRRSKQRQIYKMAQSEIELLLATKLDHKKRKDDDVWNEKEYDTK